MQHPVGTTTSHRQRLKMGMKVLLKRSIKCQRNESKSPRYLENLSTGIKFQMFDVYAVERFVFSPTYYTHRSRQMYAQSI